MNTEQISEWKTLCEIRQRVDNEISRLNAEYQVVLDGFIAKYCPVYRGEVLQVKDGASTLIGSVESATPIMSALDAEAVAEGRAPNLPAWEVSATVIQARSGKPDLRYVTPVKRIIKPSNGGFQGMSVLRVLDSE